MQPGNGDRRGEPETDRVGTRPRRIRHFRGYWNLDNTRDWVRLFIDERMPAEDIGRKVGADPTTVSTWLKKHEVDVHRGLHRKMREPPKLSPELSTLLSSGPDSVLKFLDERVWGIAASQAGMKQLTKFCRFLGLPLTVGRNETASKLGIDRSMVKAWTEGTKQPYLVRVAGTALRCEPRPGWKMLPLHLDSGGNYQGPWIQVPCEIKGSDDIAAVVKQLTPLESTYVRGERFGLSG